MVDRVVVDPASHGVHRIVEPGGLRPLETHAAVAGDVHHQAPGPEPGEVGGGEVGQGCRGVLERAVDDDVGLGQVGRQRHPTPLGADVAEVGAGPGRGRAAGCAPSGWGTPPPPRRGWSARRPRGRPARSAR